MNWEQIKIRNEDSILIVWGKTQAAAYEIVEKLSRMGNQTNITANIPIIPLAEGESITQLSDARLKELGLQRIKE
jgi:hypothetical protein